MVKAPGQMCCGDTLLIHLRLWMSEEEKVRTSVRGSSPHSKLYCHCDNRIFQIDFADVVTYAVILQPEEVGEGWIL